MSPDPADALELISEAFRGEKYMSSIIAIFSAVKKLPHPATIECSIKGGKSAVNPDGRGQYDGESETTAS